MPDLLWCASFGFIAGAIVSAPVWRWARRRERQRAAAYERLAREACQRMSRCRMAKPYAQLRAQMSPDAQRQAEVQAQALLAALTQADATAQDADDDAEGDGSPA